MEDYDWAMFFDEYASDLHTTFKREISSQLLEKIAIKTGLKQFDKYNFQLIIGMKNLYKQVINNKMYAQIDIITPTSMGLPAWIYWYSDEFDNLEELHKQDITNIPVIIDWNVDFPLKEVLSFTRPRRIDKKEKTGFSFNVEYYHFSFPDVSIEISYLQELNEFEIENINKLLGNFQKEWNIQHNNKMINYISKLKRIDTNTYLFVIDFGLENNSRTITELLKFYFENLVKLPTSKISIK